MYREKKRDNTMILPSLLFDLRRIKRKYVADRLMLKPSFSNFLDNSSNVIILRNNLACRRSSVAADSDVSSLIVCNNTG